MTEEKKELIKYRLSKAYQVFEEAKLLSNQNFFFGTTNRLYYSCFYAVLALLLLNDLNSKTHKGTLHLFYQNFIEPGLIDKKWNTLIRKVFDLRSEGDYLDYIEVEKEEIDMLIIEVKEFIDIIGNFIDQEFQKK